MRLSPLTLLLVPVALQAQDPRVGLKAGLFDAGTAISNLTLVSATRPSAQFYDSTNVGGFRYANSDLAFSGNYVFQGNFYGIQVWDISTPAAPKLRLAYPCAGGQGDPTVYGNLLFMSVEMPDGRLDCGVGTGDRQVCRRAGFCAPDLVCDIRLLHAVLPFVRARCVPGP